MEILTYILFAVGFVILIKGADLLVDGASSIAGKFKVPVLVIGLTIVAFGTSAPELIVNLMASARGSVDIAVGNIVGSNIANILLILGISAMVYPLVAKKSTVWKEIPFAFLAVLVMGILGNDMLIDGFGFSMLTRIDGIILILFFVIFCYYMFSITQSAREKSDEIVDPLTILPVWKSLAFIVVGMAGLVFGGKWIVNGAVHIATMLNVSESLIGLTVIAIGTSLPELATSVVAAYKKQADIAIGNIVGSNIFNVFWILGLSAVIRPLPLAPSSQIDILVSIFAGALLFIVMFLGKRYTVDRWQGALMVLAYIAYIVFLVLRG